ncbi:DUF2877 domain-containing protein [Actinomadura atramentaria]|uniref:oxamate carbamoyltransferase subunit AllH family protein n=1 Tax=Actinomadura atramentaria TaxID=1990 RepID=UPI00037F6BCE|nr:DUF2877 domain-containing protein [Actinomadura atramentaria]
MTAAPARPLPTRPETAAPPPGAPPLPGSASTALRGVLAGPPRAARVLARYPGSLYLELRGAAEPRVVAVVAADAARPPNSVVLAAAVRDRPFRRVGDGADVRVGEGRIEAGGLLVRARRRWDPRPALGTPAPGPCARGLRSVERALADAGGRGGLAGHPAPERLADRCAAGDLAGAVEAAERIVGLGPGLTPSGDDILAGLLASLLLVGGALRDGGRAVRLAAWLGAAVTEDAGTRTTAPSATLLHCAARGAAGAEVGAVLRAVVGREAAVPAVRRLLAVGRSSGPDLVRGAVAGARAALALAAAERAARGG